MADDYEDLYDGQGWKSNQPRDERGRALDRRSWVYTGSNSDGTRLDGRAHLGFRSILSVGAGRPGVSGEELSSGRRGRSQLTPLYGLTSVFSIGQAAPASMQPASATVAWASLVLAYSEALDSDAVPDPADFSVTEDGVAVAVTQVRVSGGEVELTLERAVGIGAMVTVGYTAGAVPLKSARGSLAADLSPMAVTNDTLPRLSVSAPVVLEGDAGSNPMLVFQVSLESASAQVTVDYADTEEGTATSGADYQALSAGTLTFEPGATAKSVTVTVTGDAAEEPPETVVIELSNPSGAALAGGAATLRGSGTILNDDVPVAGEVPASWSLTPPGLQPNDEFRLLLVTSDGTTALPEGIDPYNQHVRAAAGGGRSALKPFSASFTALVSTAAADARTHTVTTYTADDAGVPIYWVAGDKVADDYQDFLDGYWDSNDARDEDGEAVAAGKKVFTGSASDGTVDPSGLQVGRADGDVRVGLPRISGSELSGGAAESDASLPLYGLSGVFRVASSSVAVQLGTASVQGTLLTLDFGQGLDEDSVPAPGDFGVVVDGNAAAVAAVSVSGTAALLTLADPAPVGGVVTVSYAPGTTPLRTLRGSLAAGFQNAPVTNQGRPTLTISSPAVLEGADGDSTALDFEVTLAPASSMEVTVDYADSESGAAVSGTDYEALAAGTLTFTAGETVKTVSVTVSGDADAEPAESVVVELSNPVNAAFRGGGGSLSGTGTILNDDVPVAGEVPVTWGLTPAGLESGDEFRLLFVTSSKRNARPAGMGPYDLHVRRAAASGRSAVRPFSSRFSALVSLADVDARTHTVTHFSESQPGVPIYWLAGAKVAESYGDFYDGLWLSSAPTDEDGAAVASATEVFTGSGSDGTAAAGGLHAGHPRANVRVGRPAVQGSQLSGGAVVSTTALPFYGLSGVFRVGPAPAETLQPVAASANGVLVRLEYGEDLDSDSVPAPGDFIVTVGTAAATVTAVTVTGRQVILTLSEPTPVGAEVTVGYTPGAPPLRTPLGKLAGAFASQSATNETTATLSISSPIVLEGAAGEMPALSFEVTLQPAAPATVTVDYADTGGGTAMSGSDYQALAGGTLTFPPGSVARTISLTVTGDDAEEVSETVVVELSMPVNAVLLGGASELAGTGTIVNDDVPSAGEVPVSWGLTPAGFDPGAEFRLLFVTSTSLSATAVGIDHYDRHVRTAAAAGHSSLRPFSAQFSALGSTADLDARVLTVTTHTDGAPGVPIHWIAGKRVAADYGDFYDGSWEANEPTDEHGAAVDSSTEVFTGSGSDGAVAAGGLHLGRDSGNVRIGRPGSSGSELSGGAAKATARLPLYGLSGVFRVVDDPVTLLQLVSASVEGARMTLEFGEALDSGSVPAPGDFVVAVGEKSAAVSAVSVAGSTVVLALSAAVPAGEAVKVSYQPGDQPLRTPLAQRVAAFSAAAATNQTVAVLAISSPSVLEGPPGATAVLDFEVSLEPASTQTVTVDYADSGRGTAAARSDYLALAGGKLTFAPGQQRQNFSVTVNGDAVEEAWETVVVELSNPVNAALLGGGSTLRGTGTILNDEAPLAGEVPVSWGLTPAGLQPGAEFRLLFVSSAGRNARSQGIAAYDKHVRDAAAEGRSAVRPFSSAFSALASIEGLDARIHTVTISSGTDQGVPIYWLGGDRAALHYDDFYDGLWASNDPTNEAGHAVAADTRVFTGSGGDGTAAGGGLHLGQADANVRVGRPGVNGSELSGGVSGSKSTLPLYGLSGVFRVVADSAAELGLSSASVSGAAVTLQFGESLDSDFVPPLQHFGVAVDGAAATVAAVAISGENVILTLSAAVSVAETVTVSYAPGTPRLRTRLGRLVAAFAGKPAANLARPTLSIRSAGVLEGAPGQQAELIFEVSLVPASASQVTVAYSDSGLGTATVGSDYAAIAAGTLAFLPGEGSKRITVRVTGDAVEEDGETVVIELSRPVNAALDGGGEKLLGTGTIFNDEVPVTGQVPITWSLTPAGLQQGAEFRLLFVTSTGRNARPERIGAYDKHVQDAAAKGRSALRPFSSGFSALASTAAASARLHTVTGHSAMELGVPIYWVAGDKVADDYEAFYDGAWDSNAPRDEAGTAVAADAEVFTGSGSDGSAAAGGLHVGRDSGEVRVGLPGVSGSELSGGSVGSELERPLYGLSGVFRVAAASAVTLELVSASVNGTRLTLVWGEDLDSESVPAPADFAVLVDQVAAIVSAVAVDGRNVVLTLQDAVAATGAVTVAYTPGAVPLRSRRGRLAAGFGATAAMNEAQPMLSISSPAVSEGGSGQPAVLSFDVTLEPVAASTVTVTYGDSGTGTATSGTDYQSLTSGTLTFLAGDAVKTVAVTVNDDLLMEAGETVVIELSSPVNAVLRGGGETLRGTGIIIDDEVPVAGDVPVTWSLAPAGLVPNDEFRLLFVTSSATDAREGAIDPYDRLVQRAASTGRSALRPFSTAFSALASTASVDARVHTVTTYDGSDLGVPVYWVAGDRVAGNYMDFYAKSWSSNAPRNEFGSLVAADAEVFTGSSSDGTADAGGGHLGQDDAEVRAGLPGVRGSELAGALVSSQLDRPLYGLSGVFRLVAAPVATLQLLTAAVRDELLTLTFAEALDSESVPAATDFSVVVDGAAAQVLNVSVTGQTVVLTLAQKAVVGVVATVGYAPGTVPLRTRRGIPAAGFASAPVTNQTQPTLSINSPSVPEGDAGEMPALVFEVTLEPPSSTAVSVAYADSETGTASPGSDYRGLTAGRLTFSPGEVVKTIAVTVTGDGIAEAGETVVVELSSPVNAGLRGGGRRLRGTGTILNDEVPVAGDVPVTWGLIPPGLVQGAEFRLLFVTSGARNAKPVLRPGYDRHVQSAAAAGRAALRPFSSSFSALASTADVDARTYTVTAPAGGKLGVPIYWVSGAKVADDYQDFYDGGWDSNAPRDESGNVVAANAEVFTGSAADGTAAAGGLHVGHDEADVRVGMPGVLGSELSAGAVVSTSLLPLYGLSGVFTVVSAPVALQLAAASVSWAAVTLEFGDAMDSDFVPAPADFAVLVDRVAATVTAVAVRGSTAILTLDEAVGIGATVTVSYTPGSVPLRTRRGTLAAGFSPTAATNNTLPALLISSPRVLEGDSDETALLNFEVSLEPAASGTVTVAYADSGDGTATSGADYLALTAGTLTFLPGETVKTIAVTVSGDDLEEDTETVLVELSDPVNAVLGGGGRTLQGTGAILNDEVPVAGDVPVTWAFTPSDLSPGERFRLLFVTSGSTNGRPVRTAYYDEFVQESAGEGTPALVPFSSRFRVLASTSQVDARTHTVTTFSPSALGVPVYWLGGDRLANDYRDLYAGSWGSNEPRNEYGEAVALDVRVFTGSEGDGTRARGGLHLGQRESEVRMGSPGILGRELSDGNLAQESRESASVYGLSAVFTVVSAPAATLPLASAAVNGAELVLTYSEAMDPSAPPAAGDFSVTANGSAVAVSAVSIDGSSVTLTLARAVGIGESVSVSYSAGTSPLRTILGRLAAGFADFSVTNNTQPTISVSDAVAVELDSGQTSILEFSVTLSPTASSAVTVGYADISARNGTATSGADYRALPAGTLTFAPGQGAGSVRVTVLGDDREEGDETVVLELRNPVNARLRGGGATLEAQGTIVDDEAPAAGDVPVTWGLAPSDLGPSDKFRLLFVTSSKRNGRTGGLPAYDKHVRIAAADGRESLAPFKDGFRALASIATTDAREHTVTAFTPSDLGVPIYWVAGARVAGNYSELYDGTGWASNEPRDENGAVVGADVTVFTGSESDGTKAAGNLHLGHPDADVMVGSPGTAGSELASGLANSRETKPFYGLSAVFTLVAAPATMLQPVTAVVRWSELTVTYASDLDSFYAPAPEHFRPTVDGVAAAVTAVTVSGPQLKLTLAEPVPIGATVELSYTAGPERLRSALGVLVADFASSTVRNDTQPLLTVSAPRVPEGDSGDLNPLVFEVALQPATTGEVSVAYADVSAAEGTADSGADYRSFASGRLTFAPLQTSQTIRVTVIGDDDAEPHDTVVLRLSGATNAALEGGRDTLDAEGVIANDDVPFQQVPSTWSLVPDGVPTGGSFRLLFVTSSKSRGVFSQLDRYDRHVQSSALGGMAAIRPHSAHQSALVSTADAAAREHTVTSFTADDLGVPIYWLNGGKVADHYRDFYDFNWSSNSPTDERGRHLEGDVEVFTGTHGDGRRDLSGHFFGSAASERARTGKPRTRGWEIASTDTIERTESRPLYGLSGVFSVVAAGSDRVALVGASVEDEHLTLEFAEAIDFDFQPQPDDFSVTVDGAPRAVVAVDVEGTSVLLTLAQPVLLGQAVAVSYSAGSSPLLSATGILVAEVSQATAQNLSKRKLLASEPVASEGEPLRFAVTLAPPSDEVVTVGYRTSPGTAADGVDFLGSSGILTFSPGQAEAVVSIATVQDAADEPNETIRLVLSNPTNLEFSDGAASLILIGRILDDDETLPIQVPPQWELVPSGLADGDRFRLLFVSSRKHDAASESIALYDRQVIAAVAEGDEAARVFSEFFWVLASVATIDARDYTNTTTTPNDPGVPIYWFGGDRVAADYRDFYDGEWASNSPRDEFGKAFGAGVEVFTGSASDGTKDPGGRYLGTQAQGAVVVGLPGQQGLELNSGSRRIKSSQQRLYGLSGVFQVDSDARIPESAAIATLEATPSSVPEGVGPATVTATLSLTRPVRDDQEWILTVRDDGALSPDDFSAEPRSLPILVPSGETTAEASFEFVARSEAGSEPECPESVLLRARRVSESGRTIASATAEVMVTDPDANEVLCGPPADRAAVELTPAGDPNPPEAPVGPQPEEPVEGPPERLGTAARLAIWTDRTGYQPGQQLRLFRSTDPMGDAQAYRFFYYLENTGTGERLYFAPGIRSSALETDAVDQFGLNAGGWRASAFESAVREVTWVGPAPDPGSWQFVAEVLSADGPAVVKRSHAKFVVSSAAVPIGSPGAPVLLRGDRTWAGSAIHKLRGTVRVGSGATLRIEPGALIEALGPEARIIVEKGGRIEAAGTLSEPVVMTCDGAVGHREPGCWGGLAVLGDAPAQAGAASGWRPPSGSGWDYGGRVADGSSGTLSYLRVEFAGAPLEAGGPPTPALTLFGVGSGTRMEFVQAHAGLGDGIAFRGGTVSCRRCVSSGSMEDLLDWSEGWRGDVQHLFLRQGAVGRHGIHAQGPVGVSPESRLPLIFNATLIGAAGSRPGEAAGDAVRLSDGGALTAGNWVLAGFAGMAVQAGLHEGRLVGQGGDGFRNIILYRNGNGRDYDQVSDYVRRHVRFRAEDPLLRNARYEPNPDPRPGRWSPALNERTVIDPPENGGAWDSAQYAGAFGSWVWTEEWTFFGSESDFRFVRLPVLSAKSVSADEGEVFDFEVSLESPSEQRVSVRYETRAGTASDGSDFAALAGTLTFPAGETVRTISVPTFDDQLPEEAERFTLLLSDPSGAELAGRVETLVRAGTIHGSDLPAVDVPSTWSLVPPDLAVGDAFRLLFVSSTDRDARPYEVADYDDHVRVAAASGLPGLGPYSSHFRALASTAQGDARLHTHTTYSLKAGQLGVPIYWVGGDRVADDYRDFYDGSWTSNATRNESGAEVAAGVEVWTGSARDGTAAPAHRYLGGTRLAAVQIGRPGRNGAELDTGSYEPKGRLKPLYGLSGVLVVRQPVASHLDPISASVSETLLTLVYPEALANGSPPPADFRVKSGGVLQQVAAVAVDGATVSILLASPVREADSVTVSYRPHPGSPRRLRGASGALVSFLADHPVLNATELVLSASSPAVLEGSAGRVSELVFEVRLNAPGSREVTVQYADPGTAGATPGVDYEMLPAGTLTFAPGEVSQAITVRVIGDEAEECAETVFVVLSHATNAKLSGSRRELRVRGTILNDDLPSVPVYSTWSLVPQGLRVGDSFRLLFVSSIARDAADSSLATYDGFVRALAEFGHLALRPFSDHFRVLASSADTDALEHTLTSYSEASRGVPIYWLGGGKVADSYVDFYDGGWDENLPRDEQGTLTGRQVKVFTGTDSDGTRHAEGRFLGSTEFDGVMTGSPGQQGLELADGIRSKRREFSFYALSSVFRVVPPAGSPQGHVAAAVYGSSLTLEYAEPLDSGVVPSAADYAVTVAGEGRAVAEVAVVAREVILRLASRVAGGETVTVSYTPGARRLQTWSGLPASALSNVVAVNLTPPALSLSARAVVEGGRGAIARLKFDVALSGHSSETVSARYWDSREGTATAGTDYAGLPDGTVVFAPGEVAKTIEVIVAGDDLVEPSETVMLRLSAPTNAILAGGVTTLEASGWIWNDDTEPVSVPSTWRLVPPGLEVGDSFHLLFVSSNRRDATAEEISVYDEHVRAAVQDGPAWLEPYSSHFRVLASTGAADARLHTDTIHGEGRPGAPIYWVGGAKVADDYADLYDGDWDSNEFRDEFGRAAESDVNVFTGSFGDGTRDPGGRHLGAREPARVQIGKPAESGRELNADGDRQADRRLPFYGLSGVFLVGPPAEAASSTVSLRSATAQGARLALAYSAVLAPESEPSPRDFGVSAAGATRTVVAVSVQGPDVTLALSSPVAAGEAVAVTYSPGESPLRTAAGVAVPPLAAYPAENLTHPVLSIAGASAPEGEPLQFLVRLSAPSTETVTVSYRAESEVATAAADFVAAAGTLKYLPGETAQAIFVATIEDELDEANETVSVVLSEPTNAQLDGAASTAAALGRILDDDPPVPAKVPPEWGAVPAGVAEGAPFRLLFVTSSGSDAASGSMRDYDGHVIRSASGEGSLIRPFGDSARALASTASIDARDHTATTFTPDDLGFPVYWVAGSKVADSYADLYDGEWASGEPRSESGDAVASEAVVFTGSTREGTKHLSGRHLGAQQSEGVLVGRPGAPGQELDSGQTRAAEAGLPLYGLSGLFVVDSGAPLPMSSRSARLAAAQSAWPAGRSVEDSVSMALSESAPAGAERLAADQPGAAARLWTPAGRRGALGTAARFAIWTDRTGYLPSDSVRLFRSVAPMGDPQAYRYFYYLENLRTGGRRYFAPETGSWSLSDGVVDQFGMSEGAARVAPFTTSDDELIWAGAVPEAGPWQFVAQVQSADAARVVKTAYAKFMVSSARAIQIGGAGDAGVVSSDQMWTSDRIYKLRGPVRVRSGATLAVEAGTLVQASGPDAEIVVERGGRIEVHGTRRQPVVMTCDAAVGQRAPGCWKGLTLLGRAPASPAAGVLDGPGADERGGYGGSAPADSSGSLRFLRLEFAGGGTVPGPALALHGVGSGTTIEYVQSRQSRGSGIELRGGEASLDYIVATGAGGTAFAWSEGWHGVVRHLYIHQAALGGPGLAGTGGGVDFLGEALPSFYALTVIGGGEDAAPRGVSEGIRLGGGAALTAESVVVTAFPDRAIGSGTQESAIPLTARSAVRQAILHANGGVFGVAQIDPAAAPNVEFRDLDPRLWNQRFERNPDPRSRLGALGWGADASVARSGTGAAQRVDLQVGAFGAWNWAEEWTVVGGEPNRFLRGLGDGQ